MRKLEKLLIGAGISTLIGVATYFVFSGPVVKDYAFHTGAEIRAHYIDVSNGVESKPETRDFSGR